MAETTKISEQLAQFAVRTTYDDIPPQVSRRLKYLMLDAVGIAFASSRFEFAQRALLALGGLGGGAHAVIGMPVRLALRDAALMNGTLVHGLDFDDTYLPGAMHLSASAVPGMLAVGADTAASGRDALTALAIGMEVSARVAAAGMGGFQAAGFHPTGVAGTFGCTLMAARLWQMNAEQMMLAQGVALSTASGSTQPMQDGTWTKRMQPGWAASSAITAAALARQGYRAPAESYEGRFGFYTMFLGERAKLADLSLITRELGKTWEFCRASIKLFPACHQTHAFMNAAINIAARQPIKAAEVQSVKALVAKDAIALVCEPMAAKRAPADSYTAQFSLAYTVGRSLVHGGFGLADLEEAALKDADTLAVAGKLEYEIDPNAGFPKTRTGELIVTLRGGKQLRQRENIIPDELIAEEAIEAKFFRNMALATSRARAEEVRAAILGLENEPDVGRVARLLGSRGGRSG